MSAITALWVSSTEAGSALACALDSKVIGFRDQHSDNLAYLSVCEAVSEVCRAVKSVSATAIPDPYRFFTAEAKTHKVLSRPHFIACNANGELIWTDAGSHAVVMANRHNPPKCLSISH